MQIGKFFVSLSRDNNYDGTCYIGLKSTKYMSEYKHNSQNINVGKVTYILSYSNTKIDRKKITDFYNSLKNTPLIVSM